MEEFHFSIEESTEGLRIDKCISELVDSLSRSYIQKIIKEGAVSVNGSPVKVSYKVKLYDEIVFFVPDAVEPDVCP